MIVKLATLMGKRRWQLGISVVNLNQQKVKLKVHVSMLFPICKNLQKICCKYDCKVGNTDGDTHTYRSRRSSGV